MATDRRDALTVADTLARAAGRVVAEHARGSRETIERKGRNNLVTAADRAAEQVLLDGLRAAFPEHAILSEERHPDTDWRHGWVWAVDPLDGTRNFAAGVPVYAVNIALLCDGVAVLGATYDPSRDVCITGGPGLGVRANGEPVTGPRASDLASAVVSADLGYDDHRAALMLETLQALWPGMQAIRIPGSAALGLAWTAAGYYDLNLHAMLYPWDIAVGLALVPAAGGVIRDRDGGPATPASEGVVAGSPGAVAEFFARAGERPWR